MRRPGDAPSEDLVKPGNYTARRDNVDRFWRHQFGQTHALALMWSFFEWVDRPDGNKVELLFKPQTAQLMYVPCLYADWRAMTARACLASPLSPMRRRPRWLPLATTDAPINLTHDAAQRWLQPEGKTSQDLQAILDERQRPF